MPMIFNPREEDVSLCIGGSWFNFPKGKIKRLAQPEKANFIARDRQYTGLVVLSDKFDPDQEGNGYVEGYEKTPEGKEELKQAGVQGINNLIENLLKVIRNNQVHLARDYAIQFGSPEVGAKMAKFEASSGELEAMRLVAKYKGRTPDNAQKKAEEIEDLMNKIGPISG